MPEHRQIPRILLAVALLYVAWLGVLGTDYGRHWDEPRIVTAVIGSFEAGWVLPGWYNYPSLPHDIALLVALPTVSWNSLGIENNELAKFISSPTYTLRLRAVFFVLSLLSGIAVHAFVRELEGNSWGGLVAALTLVSSWEFVYHARWIAPDTLLVLFVSLSLVTQHRILASTERRQRRLWAIVSAVVAGLCIGTKYPGGIVLAPLLIAVWLASGDDYSRRDKIDLSMVSTLVAVLTFVATTPGSLLQPVRFLNDVLFEIGHYATGHGGYTVDSGVDHFYKLVTYLVLVMPSKNAALAGAASLVGLVGVVALARTRPKSAAWFLSIPILYVAYMASQHVMIVRNYMLLLPYLAVSVALGVVALHRAAMPRRSLRAGLVGCVIVFLGVNLVAVTRSSLSIDQPSTAPPGPALEAHLASSPETTFHLSPACLDLLKASSSTRPANVVDRVDLADRFVFLSTEPSDWKIYPANVPGRYGTVWSPMDEVNWDFYPTWRGNPRILEISTTDRDSRGLLDDLARHPGR